jgi:hypothetical protein
VATLIELITDALGEIGVLGSGAAPDASQAAHALRRINDLLGQYAADPGLIYKVTATEWTIVASTQNYSVGVGSTVNVAPPALNAVQSIGFKDTTPDPDYEFCREKPYSEEEWASITIKAQTATYPQRAYYNPTVSTATISLWPIPTASNLKGILYALEAVAQFAAVTDTISLPDQYRRMLVKNLALELAPSYKMEPSQLLVAQARESRSIVRAANFRPENMIFPRETLISERSGGGASNYDIRRG